MAWGTGERDARTVKMADLTAAGTMTRSLGRFRPPTYHPFGLRIQPLMRRRQSRRANATTSGGPITAPAKGHATIVVDRQADVLVGVFLAGPGVSETIHEAVLAIKLRTPLSVLADTIHAFPTVARVLGTAFVNAHREREDGPIA